MKDFLAYSTIIAMVLFSGCEGPKTGEYTMSTPPSRRVSRSKRITLVVDTQPSGAAIYHQVEGGAWMKCQSTTPVRFVLDLKQTMANRPPKLIKVNERSIQEYEGGLSGRPHLGCGFFYAEAGWNRYISLDNIQLRKNGYEPYLPKRHVNLYSLLNYIDEEYKIVFQLKAKEVTKAPD